VPFAGSTFPGILGIFTLNHYSQLAASLILQLLNIFEASALATEMIRSFIFSMHRFCEVPWERFW
jgi:hypothetical protein